MFKNKIYLHITLLFFCSQVLSNIVAHVDKGSVSYGETLVFSLQIDSSLITQPPDFKELKNSFDILNTRQVQSISIINGVKKTSKEWQLMLRAKSKGDLTIPSIKIGSYASLPIKIHVGEQSSVQPQNHNHLKHVFMDFFIDNKQPILQEQVILTVKIYYQNNLIKGNLIEPKIHDAIIVSFDKDNKYQEEKNGEVYDVLERKYAFFPQKSGELRIESPTFEGLLVEDSTSEWNTDPFDIGNFFQVNKNRPVNLVGEPLTLVVKGPVEEKDLKYWLPAHKISVTESWDNTANIKVGQPITRTILLQAEGLSGEQLPNLVDLAAHGFNSYHDKPKFNNTVTKNLVLGTREDLVTYIPTQKGTVVLPAISLKWWNKNTKRFETVTLPEKNIEVLASSHEVVEVNKPISQQVKKDLVVNKHKESSTWFLLTILLGILWLLTIIFILGKSKIKVFFERFRRVFNRTKPVTESAKLSKIFKLLKKSCKNNDMQLVKKYLLLWAKVYFKDDLVTLSSLASRFSDPLAYEIKYLDIAIYKDLTETWDGTKLLKCLNTLKNIKRLNKRLNNKKSLPPLNPN